MKIRRRLTRQIHTVFVTNRSREVERARRLCSSPARPSFHKPILSQAEDFSPLGSSPPPDLQSQN